LKKVACLLLGLTVIVFLALLAGCADETEDEPTVEEIIKIGKKYLSNGDAVGAADAFNAALKRDPNNADAKYGILLANTLQFGNLISELLGMLEGFMAVDDGGDGDIETLSESPAIGDLIQDFFVQVLEPKFVQSNDLYYELTFVPDLQFDLERYELVIADMTLVDFSGVFGDAELHFFGTVNSLLLAVTNLLLAHDVNFDFDNLVIPEFGDDIMESIDAIVDLLRGLLSDPNYPNFLYLKEDGVFRMQATGLNLGLTFLRLNFMIEAVKNDTGDQSDDPIRYIDENGNGLWDEDEAVEISGLAVIEPELIPVISNLAGDLAVAIFDTTPLDIDPLDPNPFYPASLNDILIYLIDGLDTPIIPPGFLPIDLGPFFAAPSPDGLRNILELVVEIWDLVGGFF